MNIPLRLIRTLAVRFPAVVPYLKGRARWVVILPEYKELKRWLGNNWHDHFGDEDDEFEILYTYKAYDFFLTQVERLIRSVYNNNLGGEFIDIMANLISGQLTQAFEQAWKDEEGEGDLPDYLTGALEDLILSQYDHVDGLYRDIVDARVDETPLEPLLARAPLWAQRWTEGYNQAVALITAENGGNLVWQLGATEQHCVSCSALNGIVAPASVWEELGVHPQGAPNDLIECGGWQCDCSLTPTDKRRSPKAYDTILNIVQKGQ